MNEWTSTQALVDSTFGVYIKHNVRQRPYVEARAVFYKIMKELYGKSLSSIGRRVNRTHASVINGLRNIDNWMVYDVELKQKYDSIMLQIIDTNKEIEEYLSYEEILDQNISLRSDVQNLSLTIQSLEKELNRRVVKEYRFEILFDRIEHQIPKGKEHMANMKINQFLNGLSL